MKYFNRSVSISHFNIHNSISDVTGVNDFYALASYSLGHWTHSLVSSFHWQNKFVPFLKLCFYFASFSLFLKILLQFFSVDKMNNRLFRFRSKIRLAKSVTSLCVIFLCLHLYQMSWK